MNKTVTLRGLLIHNNSEWKALTLYFVDDDFTHDYLLYRDENYYGKSPVSKDSGLYYVKYKSLWNLACFASEKKENRIPVDDLINSVVCMEVQVKRYNYKSSSGWSLQLVEMWKDDK